MSEVYTSGQSKTVGKGFGPFRNGAQVGWNSYDVVVEKRVTSCMIVSTFLCVKVLLCSFI